MSLTTPESIGRLQRKLYCKAKAEPGFRFYLLYDKICREDMLLHAWRLCRANGGARGVDGVSFEAVEEGGQEEWLAGLRTELVGKTYRPAPVRRGLIPKPGGGGGAPGLPARRGRGGAGRRPRARHPDDPGPGGADCGQAGAGTDLRGGLRGQRVWLPAQAGRDRRDQ